MPSALHAFRFDNRFARELPEAGVAVQPVPVAAPRLLFLNEPLAQALGLDLAAVRAEDAAAVFAGNRLPEGAEPVAQAYAGHQFGGFSPQLGDGRALLLGEVLGPDGARHDVALKGSGRTPFSRGGDGRAALGPMLREVLVSECLHALGIPTTRALAVAATGEGVRRERMLPGAVLTRVAASHLRVGTLQYFASRGDLATLRRVADHAVSRHDAALAAQPEPQRWVALLSAVADRQARLIAQWMNVGFIHGVMNTDNMTLSGESIDFGPCAFLEAYDLKAVFSSIDHGGRYAYGNQPLIARWNLARMAEALLPLMADADDEASVRAAVARVMPVIDGFPERYEQARLQGLAAKLGLPGAELEPTFAALAADWLEQLQAHQVDFTLGMRLLADAAAGREAPLRTLFENGPDAALQRARAAVGSEAWADASSAAAPGLVDWLQRWQATCREADGRAAQAQGAALDPVAAGGARREAMRRVNPAVIARNHRVESALDAATDEGRLEPFEALLAVLRRPFDDDDLDPAWQLPASPETTAVYQTFCGT